MNNPVDNGAMFIKHNHGQFLGIMKHRKKSNEKEPEKRKFEKKRKERRKRGVFDLSQEWTKGEIQAKEMLERKRKKRMSLEVTHDELG